MANRFTAGNKAISECDRCGIRVKLKDLKNLVIKTKQVAIKVCNECWEEDHPQLQLGMYPVADPQAVRDPRPDFAGYAQSRSNIVPVQNFLNSEEYTSAGGAIGTVTFSIPAPPPPPPVACDPYFAYVSLLLHMDGSNGSTTFTDNSPSPKTVTANGAAQVNTSVVKYGTGSYVGDGSGDYLTATVPGGLGASDFTIEYWVYPLVVSGFVLNSRTSGTGADGIDLSVAAGVQTAFQQILPDYSAFVPINTWTYIAIVRQGSTWYRFFNGTLYDTGTNANNFTGTDFTIGGSPHGNVGYINGYIDDFRITVGVARYTANFTPPTAAFPDIVCAGGDPYYPSVSLLLHMDGSNGSTTFTDNSPSPKTVTSNGNTLAEVSTSVVKYGTGSCNFKSSNNYLRANAIASEFDFGTGDFTVEFWVNWSAVDDSGFVSGNENGSFDFAYVSGTLRVGRINTAWDTTVTWITPTAGVWYYIAYSRSGSDLRIFVNGTQVTPTSSNSTNYTASLVNVGLSRAVSDDRPFKGYMDDLRITKGVARYTANFTPPAAPFPNS